MNIKNVIGKIVHGGNGSVNSAGHNELIKKMLFASCVILVLILAYALGNFLFMRPEISTNNRNNAVVVDSDIYFKDCKILRKGCSNKVDCSLFSFCGSGSYKVCNIYDCGTTYGVFTEDYEGNISTPRKAKYDKKAVQAKKDACGGSMQILQQDCVDKKMQVKVKLAPKGECKIGGFTLVYEETGLQQNTFTSLSDDTYSITADTCGKITKIVPQTEEGISIF
jgi:hypothetical protein